MADFLFDKFRGLADSKWSGVKGSFPKMVGLDIHSQPGIITVQQKLTRNSPSSGANDVDALCRAAVAASNGYQFWFSYTSGKIWARSSGGTWTLAYTTAPAAGSAGCLGAAEYDGYIYWATQSRLHRIAIGNADDSWASVDLNWQTFGVTNASFHPMVEINQALFIGDGNRVAKVDNTGTFNGNVLDIEPPHIVKSMSPFGIDLVVGTTIASTVNRCKVVRWDTVQSSWQFAEEILENGVNNFLWTQNALVVQAGRYGNFYIYDGQTLQPFKRLPGTWSTTQYGEVYPGSSANFKGVAVFGFSNGAGNPADQGVYSLGRYSKDYPLVFSGPDWVISQNDVTAVEIGAILVEDNDLFVAWTDGADFGVDRIDASSKYSSAYLEFPVIMPDGVEVNEFVKYIANYSSLPSGTSLTFQHKLNHAASWTTFGNTAVQDTDRAQYWLEDSVQARVFQLRVNFNVSGNSAPEIENFIIQTQ